MHKIFFFFFLPCPSGLCAVIEKHLLLYFLYVIFKLQSVKVCLMLLQVDGFLRKTCCLIILFTQAELHSVISTLMHIQIEQHNS